MGQLIYETWKDITDYEGYYQVSNLGRVRSVDRFINGAYGDIKKKGVMLFLSQSKNGYLHATLHKEGTKKTFNVHRLVAQEFIENIDNKKYVNHIDCNKVNNCIDNLEWVTHSENILHSYASGTRSKKGEKHHMNKLTKEQVISIRRFAEYFSQTKLSKLYNVSISTINDIVHYRSWKHIGGEV